VSASFICHLPKRTRYLRRRQVTPGGKRELATSLKELQMLLWSRKHRTSRSPWNVRKRKGHASRRGKRGAWRNALTAKVTLKRKGNSTYPLTTKGFTRRKRSHRSTSPENVSRRGGETVRGSAGGGKEGFLRRKRETTHEKQKGKNVILLQGRESRLLRSYDMCLSMEGKFSESNRRAFAHESNAGREKEEWGVHHQGGR